MCVPMKPEALESGGQSETPTRFVSPRWPRSSRREVPQPVQRALRWAWREILLALLAAFIVGLGAGAAEALIAWATR